LYVGPLADIAGGVDLSTIGSAALAGLIYFASLSLASRRKLAQIRGKKGEFAFPYLRVGPARGES
ncbi:MAG: hypothetical protein WAL26_12515, partial [Mycobacterium sp.]